MIVLLGNEAARYNVSVRSGYGPYASHMAGIGLTSNSQFVNTPVAVASYDAWWCTCRLHGSFSETLGDRMKRLGFDFLRTRSLAFRMPFALSWHSLYFSKRQQRLRHSVKKKG
jgi:hypothetical protein